MSKMLPHFAVAVAAFLGGGLTFHYLGKADVADAGSLRQFAVDGMTCEGCASAVTGALTKVPGVRSARVSLTDNTASVVADSAEVPNDRLIAAIAAAGFKASPIGGQSPPNAPAPTGAAKQPVMVNITRGKDSLHAVSMGIGLALSALKDGRQAAVFLNAEAPVLGVKNLPDEVQFADFPPVRKMLTDFMAAGGRLLVCQHCAHVCKCERHDLLDGAVLADHHVLFDALPPGIVVFSY